MKKFASILLVALLLMATSGSLFADTYVAGLSGVECNDCKRKISRSLGKLPGVQTIRITKTGESQHRITVTTDGSAPISQAQANQALKHADHYQLTSWKKSN